MAILEQVMHMKQQGITEGQIAQSLRQQGISPKEINEALSQAKIKSAVSQEQQNQDASYQNEQTSTAQMQPSMMSEGEYPPEQGQYQQEAAPYPQEQYQAEQPGAEYQGYQQPQQEYQQEGQYPPQEQEQYQNPGVDIETINDIATQIVEEKNAELKKQVSSFAKFKEEKELEIEKINQRLTKIETLFNELQMAIIRKVGEYGEDIKTLKDEMHETQDSFSKVLNPLTDTIRDFQKITGRTSSQASASAPTVKTRAESMPEKQIESPKSKNAKSTKSRSPNVEDYLR